MNTHEYQIVLQTLLLKFSNMYFLIDQKLHNKTIMKDWMQTYCIRGSSAVAIQSWCIVMLYIFDNYAIIVLFQEWALLICQSVALNFVAYKPCSYVVQKLDFLFLNMFVIIVFAISITGLDRSHWQKLQKLSLPPLAHLSATVALPVTSICWLLCILLRDKSPITLYPLT